MLLRKPSEHSRADCALELEPKGSAVWPIGDLMLYPAKEGCPIAVSMEILSHRSRIIARLGRTTRRQF